MLLAVLLLFTSAPANLPLAARAAAARTPSPLPHDRLHFGLSNEPGDFGWLQASGVPFRYRYTYLSGGVNTNQGWETWNTPTGQYASYYLNDSQSFGAVPVFSYYEICQSNGPNGPGDPKNLNNTSTMAAFYANFKLLLQTAGAYGKAVVVHVEPDLWGYLEQRAGGQDASTLTASVASSGFAEAAGIPNTAQGFAWTLLKLRDMYAPNAILALHASAWGSGIDIASSTDPTVNPASVADATAAFLNSAGITSNPYGSTWDVVFNDLDDHDAGWWETGCGGCINAGHTHWWDPTNTAFPNFSRYLAWVAELAAKTSRPQVAWQVPVGNQYFLTMNNTCGHYQDNVAQYFLGHPADLFSAGLIAVLFGSGNGCQTTNTDLRADGVTNNGGAPTTDALGYCTACNTHTSIYADDDGGFLRIFVGQYYALAKPAAPAGVSAVPFSSYARVSWTAPADNGSPITAYRVTPYLGGTSAGTPVTYASAETNEAFTGLAFGSAYRFSVAAINGVGIGPESALSNLVSIGSRLPVLPAPTSSPPPRPPVAHNPPASPSPRAAAPRALASQPPTTPRRAVATVPTAGHRGPADRLGGWRRGGLLYL
ncbi:MAG: fibronectin type III domain-containing protein [Chloroflexi bacterium]|nr:MAG: fibronectin type III domain-containing protein [Chloroflexota bacterium]